MLADFIPFASLSIYAGLGIDQPGLSYRVDPWAVKSVSTQVDPYAAVSLGGSRTAVSISSGVEPFQAVSSY